MILSKPQARRAYDMLCALSATGARSTLDARFDHFGISQNNFGKVRVRDYRKLANDTSGREVYPTQTHFAVAYGLRG